MYNPAKAEESDVSNNPFDLNNDAVYEAWRDAKMVDYPTTAEALVVSIADLANPTEAEFEAMMQRLRQTNMVVYAAPENRAQDKHEPEMLGIRFGLRVPDQNWGADEDGITALQVEEGQWRAGYIPYTNRAIHWHTDGYYNSPTQQVRAVMLHCVRPACEGGENQLLDQDLVYIHLRDENPDFIRALMGEDVMMIPANIKNGQELRPDRPGPVFSVDEQGAMHMRYTARARNVVWSDDALVQEAKACLEAFIEDTPYQMHHTLQSGQGLISNNVLHNRSAFTESEECKRLLYRLRFYSRVQNS